MTYPKTVLEALEAVQEPMLKKSLMQLGMLRDILVEGDRVRLTLALTSSRCSQKDAMAAKIKEVVEALPGIVHAEINLTILNEEELKQLFPAHPLIGLDKVRRVLAVASGKGGVGKTTIAVNTALALVQKGHRTGLLDADVYGPSVPLMLGLNETPAWENQMMIPVEKFGLEIMSLGMLAEAGKPMVWRGPIVAKAINQLLKQVIWEDLDYLVIDLPPGTGDPSITVAQSIPNAFVLMVTTPQEVALADVRRAIDLFEKFNLHILGLVENMSYFFCDQAAKPIEIFGRGGGETLSREYGLPLLGRIPIDPEIAKSCDSGLPLMVSAPDGEAGKIFRKIAQKVMQDHQRQRKIRPNE